MARILAIDYGRKRCGLAVTDVLQITPGGLATVRTHELVAYLQSYLSREAVERILVGHPRQMNHQESESMTYIRLFVAQLEKLFPSVAIELVDERFTSTLAQRTIREAGIGKIRRQADKGLVDEISAVIILQSYLASRDGLGTIHLPD
ncbi:Holliday junction resolvase RuvX [Porphyromonas sp. COT-290 OH3588]|uniref:Holliday junction resolvase RuvX n=1 Tax=Porphyromonas sp. COT-290 OH3588 TaxID=1515617 RepID=UPI00052D5DE1|nr:Holliday junction resolvase RuvX [Porphyromonas sp. COT-290 OH3588]KGO00775.1 Holliday junction resolvase [Porphyromonas sp. COT-290 OH3588]